MAGPPNNPRHPFLPPGAVVTTSDEVLRRLRAGLPTPGHGLPVAHPLPDGGGPVPVHPPQGHGGSSGGGSSGGGALMDSCCSELVDRLDAILRELKEASANSKRDLFASMLMQQKPPITSSGAPFACGSLGATSAFYPCFRNERSRVIAVRFFAAFTTAGAQVYLSKGTNTSKQVGLLSDAAGGYLETNAVLVKPGELVYAGSANTNITLTSSDIISAGITDPAEVFDYLR